MLNKQQKQKQIDWLVDRVKSKRSTVLASYRGLNIADITELRRALKEQEIAFKVVKSSLLAIALKKLGLELDAETQSMPLAAAFGDDEAAPAKLMVAFSKDHEALRVVGGVVEKKLVGVGEIRTLASLPSREEFYAKLISALQNPTYRFVNALRHPLSGLVGVLRQRTS